MDLEQVYLEDSWVLGVETYESHVWFLLDAVATAWKSEVLLASET